MLNPDFIQQEIDNLTDEFMKRLQLLTIKVGTGQDYAIELHNCKMIVSKVAELEEYLEAFKTIYEVEED